MILLILHEKKKTDFDKKLININKKVNSNKKSSYSKWI